MTLRPIDMQVLLPKISEVNRGQPIQNQQDQTEQQQFAAQFQKQAEIQRHQVQNSNKTEGSKIDQQAKEKGSSRQQEDKNAKDRQKDEQTAGTKDPGKGNLLDIKI